MFKNTLLATIVTCVAAVGAVADEASELSGSYKYAPDQSADVPQAIDKAIEKMNFIKRPIARSRLATTNKPYQKIHIELGASEVVITYDDQAPIRMPLGGESIKWTRADGEVFNVAASFDGSKLVQTYKAEDGQRVNAFTKQGGALQMDVEVSSPQLPQPLKYALLYRPAS
jgi:hypothetical protein